MSGGDDDPVALLPKLHEQLRAAGRRVDGFEVTIYFCPPNPETVKRFADGGIDRVLFPLPSVPEADALEILDGYAKLI